MGITHRLGVSLKLLKGIRFHKVPELTIGIEILHGAFHHISALKTFTRLEGTLPDAAGIEIAQFYPVECLALARLNELVIEDAAGLAVQHDLQARAKFVGRVIGHGVLVLLGVTKGIYNTLGGSPMADAGHLGYSNDPRFLHGHIT